MDRTPCPDIPLSPELYRQLQLRNQNDDLRVALVKSQQEVLRVKEELRKANEEIRRLTRILEEHGLGHLI